MPLDEDEPELPLLGLLGDPDCPWEPLGELGGDPEDEGDEGLEGLEGLGRLGVLGGWLEELLDEQPARVSRQRINMTIKLTIDDSARNASSLPPVT